LHIGTEETNATVAQQPRLRTNGVAEVMSLTVASWKQILILAWLREMDLLRKAAAA